MKRLSDVVIACIAMVLLFPFFVLAALGTLLSSGRPVLFSQERLGLDLQPISITKIRTMQIGADAIHPEMLRAQFAKTGNIFLGNELDGRVTRLGIFLRRSSIDEYPQLLNVIRGEMSIVGPRPMLPFEVSLLSENQLRRFHVKPGLTGLAQVSGRKLLHSHKSLDLDLDYVDSQTLGLYYLIILKTPWAIISGAGAR